MRYLGKYAGLLAASLLLSACGGEDKAELSRVAKKYNLDQEEKLAFKACWDLSGSTKPIINYGSTRMVVQVVPIDACGCQARPILKVMQPGKFDTYANFARWIAKPERRGNASLMRADLRDGMDAPKGTAILAKSFDSCMADLAVERPNLAKETFLSLADDPALKAKAEQRKRTQASMDAQKNVKIDW
jgi:hypothetical protein